MFWGFFCKICIFLYVWIQNLHFPTQTWSLKEISIFLLFIWVPIFSLYLYALFIKA